MVSQGLCMSENMQEKCARDHRQQKRGRRRRQLGDDSRKSLVGLQVARDSLEYDLYLRVCLLWEQGLSHWLRKGLLLLLLLSCDSRVWLCATPEMAAHQAPPSLGFSRQEHWSGLPFPFPMHESEKWEWSCSVVSDSLRPHGLQPTRLLRPWDSPGKSTGVGCHCLLRRKGLGDRKC